MLNLNKKFNFATIRIALLFVLLLPSSKAVRTSSRFFYENEPQNAALRIDDNETTQDETNFSATNLSLIGEQIPLEFYSKLDNVSDTDQFIDLFVEKDTIPQQLGILGKNLKRNVERANAVSPKPAICMPESTTVSLKPLDPSKDPKIGYYPKCTRVKRCGGCCNHDRMSCQPVEREYINFEVAKFRYGEDKATLLGREIVVIEQHKSCRCDCRIKAEHCNSYQNYHPELCSCVCTNNDAKEKCLLQDLKIWDEEDCRCVCREPRFCTTGTIFDESQCQCINPNLNRHALEDRRRFVVKAIPVSPDDSTVYNAE